MVIQEKSKFYSTALNYKLHWGITTRVLRGVNGQQQVGLIMILTTLHCTALQGSLMLLTKQYCSAIHTSLH